MFDIMNSKIGTLIGYVLGFYFVLLAAFVAFLMIFPINSRGEG